MHPQFSIEDAFNLYKIVSWNLYDRRQPIIRVPVRPLSPKILCFIFFVCIRIFETFLPVAAYSLTKCSTLHYLYSITNYVYSSIRYNYLYNTAPFLSAIVSIITIPLGQLLIQQMFLYTSLKLRNTCGALFNMSANMDVYLFQLLSLLRFFLFILYSLD